MAPELDQPKEPTRSSVARRRESGALRNVRAVVLRSRRTSRTLQDRLLHLLGSDKDRRSQLVAGMLARSAHESTSYWLQLVVSIGIATLGLVVGSAAVIIGAMLVAPLMGPIIALAMGLAAGSPFLVLRSAMRIVLSVVAAIAGAATITVLLPFHELNSEIAARTSPTVLDLLTAGFCALAGVYASMRPGSDTATTAAGTSIGISLVPPLCASGYGFGTGAWPVAGGAALLFLTNLVAIIVVGTLSFVAAGFNRVDATVLERDELAKNNTGIVTAAIGRRLAGLFESKAGPALRFLMPILLLAAVYTPLRRALDEVAWEVRARAAVQHALAKQRHRIVQTRVRVERHEIELLVVLVGKTADADAVRTDLGAELQAAAGVEPRVDVLAIPDSKAFAGLESTLRTAGDPLPLQAPPPPPSASEQIDTARALVKAHVGRLWPAAVAGEPLLVRLDASERGPLRVEVVHLGRSLGSDALETLRLGIGQVLEREVEVVGTALPGDPITRSEGDLQLLARVMPALRQSAAVPDVSVCVVRPEQPSRGGRRAAADRELAEVLGGALAAHPRVTAEAGSDWSVRFVRGACPPPASGPAVLSATAQE